MTKDANRAQYLDVEICKMGSSLQTMLFCKPTDHINNMLRQDSYHVPQTFKGSLRAKLSEPEQSVIKTLDYQCNINKIVQRFVDRG